MHAPGMRSPSAVILPSPQVYMKHFILGSTTCVDLHCKVQLTPQLGQ